MEPRIRDVIQDHARLAVDVATLSNRADLWIAGMSSHASVSLMIALEAEFRVEFPDQMLRPATFASVSAIMAALTDLGAQAV